MTTKSWRQQLETFFSYCIVVFALGFVVWFLITTTGVGHHAHHYKTSSQSQSSP